MINWQRVAFNREGRNDEGTPGSGRTTTMLINALDYVTRVQEVEPGCVILVLHRSDISIIKRMIRSLARDLGMFVTKELENDIWVNDCRLSIILEYGGLLPGIGYVFVDHACKVAASNKDSTSIASRLLCQKCGKRQGEVYWTGDGGTSSTYPHWCSLCCYKRSLEKTMLDVGALEKKIKKIEEEEV